MRQNRVSAASTAARGDENDDVSASRRAALNVISGGSMHAFMHSFIHSFVDVSVSQSVQEVRQEESLRGAKSA